MFPIVQVGPIAIQVPGLILLAGIWVGITLSESFLLTHKKPLVTPDDISKLTFIALIAAILGARLGYILRYPTAFGQNLQSLLSLNPGLLDPLAGIATGLIASVIYGQRKSLPLWPTLDALTPLFMILNVAIPLSNLASGAAYGIATTLPWAIELFGADRHPTQIYEFLAAGSILFYFWSRKFSIIKLRQGRFFLQFVALGEGALVFLYGFRADGSLFNGWRVSQLVAWVLLALSLWQLRKGSTAQG